MHIRFFIFFYCVCLGSFSYAIDNNAHDSYKSLDNFIIIGYTHNRPPGFFHTHYKAQEKINDRPPDSTYENNQWHLIQRDGLYLAQVDKAVSEIYRYYVGYSTDSDIVQDGQDYYLARRDFKNFKHWNDAVTTSDNKIYINGYLLHSDGSLTKDGITKKFTGLGSFAVLSGFVSDSDATSDNWGIQETDSEIKFILYDNEHAFSENLFYMFTDNSFNAMEYWLANYPQIISMPWYKQECDAIIKKIADKDFSAVESIIKRNISSTLLEEYRYSLLNHLELDDNRYQEMIKKVSQVNLQEEQQEYGAEQIIKVLSQKRTQLLAKPRQGYVSV